MDTQSGPQVYYISGDTLMDAKLLGVLSGQAVLIDGDGFVHAKPEEQVFYDRYKAVAHLIEDLTERRDALSRRIELLAGQTRFRSGVWTG